MPRKGGPGATASDLLVVNKTDLATHVRADLRVMARDAERMRRGGLVLFTRLVAVTGASEVAAWVLDQAHRRGVRAVSR